MQHDIKYLFRYYSVPDNEEQYLGRIDPIFSRSEIYFPSPTQFNDPFDCMIPPLLEGTEDDWRLWYERLISAENQSLDDQQIERRVSEKLGMGWHRDKNFVRESTVRALETILEQTGVLCLSAKNGDILMWSHYSNGHTGFCLQFEANDNTPFFNFAQPVVYKKKYPALNRFEATNDQILEASLLTKTSRWKYEQEWRIISNKDFSAGCQEGPGIHQFPLQTLLGVIFGCRMTDAHKEKIRTSLKNGKQQVQIFEAKKNDLEFGIDIIPSETLP